MQGGVDVNNRVTQPLHARRVFSSTDQRHRCAPLCVTRDARCRECEARQEGPLSSYGGGAALQSSRAAASATRDAVLLATGLPVSLGVLLVLMGLLT